MRIYYDINLRDFKPWNGGKAVFNRLTTDELNTLEDILNDDPAVYTETDINDLFWFDDEWILEVLNIDKDEFWKREA